jgi:hypothetical protein
LVFVWQIWLRRKQISRASLRRGDGERQKDLSAITAAAAVAAHLFTVGLKVFFAKPRLPRLHAVEQPRLVAGVVSAKCFMFYASHYFSLCLSLEFYRVRVASNV